DDRVAEGVDGFPRVHVHDVPNGPVAERLDLESGLLDRLLGARARDHAGAVRGESQRDGLSESRGPADDDGDSPFKMKTSLHWLSLTAGRGCLDPSTGPAGEGAGRGPGGPPH